MNMRLFGKGWVRAVRRGILMAVVVEVLGIASAATYRVGDVVDDVSFVARREFTRPDGTTVPAGAPVHLRDLEGRIVFLEWFAVWCPYCVAAAPQVETGIVEWYGSRGGNPHGVPVLHIAVNQEASPFYQPQTDAFIDRHGFGIVVNDYDAVRINPVRFRFQSGGQPIFVVINGVTNSPTHKPWELLVNHLGYGDRDFNLELAGFRALIDSVRPGVAAPILTAPRRVDGGIEFQFQGQAGRAYRVEVSTDLIEWMTLSSVTAGNGPTAVRAAAAEGSRRYYRVVTP